MSRSSFVISELIDVFGIKERSMVTLSNHAGKWLNTLHSPASFGTSQIRRIQSTQSSWANGLDERLRKSAEA
jgi:hypothetical protein